MSSRIACWQTTVQLLALGFVLGLFSSPKVEAQTRALVGDFSGPGGDAARGEVISQLEAHQVQVPSSGEVRTAAASAGGNETSPETAAQLGASVIIKGRVQRHGRRFSARIEVIDAASGRRLESATFAARSATAVRGEVRSDFWRRLGSAVGHGHVPTARRGGSERDDETGDDEPIPRLGEGPSGRGRSTSARQDEGDEEGGDRPRGISPLWVAVGVTTPQWRELSYVDGINNDLRPYRGPIFAARLAARWYPIAHFSQELFANIGLDLAFGTSIAQTTTLPNAGLSYPTESYEFRGGLEFRLPIDSVELGFAVGYGIHTFALGLDQMQNPADFPNVEYQFVRPAVRGRFDLGIGLYAETAFGWRALTATGSFGGPDWFPRNSGQGFDFSVHFGWESDIGLGARLGFDMQRYFFSINPEPGDPKIAGGALDQYLAATIDLVYRLR